MTSVNKIDWKLFYNCIVICKKEKNIERREKSEKNIERRETKLYKIEKKNGRCEKLLLFVHIEYNIITNHRQPIVGLNDSSPMK